MNNAPLCDTDSVMVSLFLSLAFAQNTRLFPTDEEARAWVRHTRQVSHQRLPIIGPPDVRRLVSRGSNANVRVVVVPKGENLDAAALEARLEDGSPCALIFAKTEATSDQASGWAGWISGSCGQLSLGSWQVEDGRVLDFRGRAITVPQFAIATGDRSMLRTYRKLDRRRGRGITFTLLGTGALWFSLINGFDESGSLPKPVLIGLTGVGGAVAAVGVFDLVTVGTNPHAQPRNIGAHLDQATLRSRVIEHNKHLSVFIGPGSAHGSF